MNAKKRLLSVLSGDKVDRVPCICPGGMMNMIITELMNEIEVVWPEAHLDSKKMVELAKAVYDYGMFENYGVPFCMTVEVEEMGAEINMGDTKFEPRVIKYVIDTVSDYKNIKPLDINSGRAKVVTEVISILKDKNEGVPVIGNISGPISVASSLMEPVAYYKDLRKKNEDAHKFMEYITDQIIRFAEAQVKAGADVIAISDPSGTGEILGPKYFEGFAIKYINNLIDGIKNVDNKNTPVIVHICGRMHNVYSELKQLKADAFSFDAMVNIKELKKHMGDRILMGNVSSFVLEYGSQDKIKSLTLKAMEDGVDIISPACGLGTQSPLRNIQTILKTVKGECTTND